MKKDMPHAETKLRGIIEDAVETVESTTSMVTIRSTNYKILIGAGGVTKQIVEERQFVRVSVQNIYSSI